MKYQSLGSCSREYSNKGCGAAERLTHSATDYKEDWTEEERHRNVPFIAGPDIHRDVTSYERVSKAEEQKNCGDR